MDPLMSNDAILINDARACASLLVRNSKLFNNPQYWHKVTIHNCEGIHRDVLLKAILDATHPNDLIPVNFKKENLNASFLARNCKTAIVKLCENNLIVANPLNNNLPFKLSIILAYSTTNDLQINVQDNVLEVLNKRYNSTTKTLNLDTFHKDPDLKEFCVLSQPKILYFVLHLSKNLTVHHLKLNNNDISVLNPVESLWGVKNLTSLDLRYNSIDSIKKLTILSSLSIRDLWLDGNPLCDKYDEYTYVQAVKEVCPQIEKLDGVILRQGGFPAFRRNYLCNPECQEMIDNFMEHYFTIYDCKNQRNKLLGIYEQNATFSITSRYLVGQTTSATASLTPYKLVSRNIRTLSDLAKSDENLIVGNEKIIKVIQNLPPTQHDPYTFTVDLMHYTDALILLVVNGVFREPTDNLSAPERILGFTRTFTLGANDNNEYRIINEQLHVSNATTIQQQRAFKLVKVAKETSPPFSFTETEKKEMIEAVKTFTTMNAEWSKKCLEECHYNLPKALSLFVDLYKVDNIPEEAFQSESALVDIENTNSEDNTSLQINTKLEEQKFNSYEKNLTNNTVPTSTVVKEHSYIIQNKIQCALENFSFLNNINECNNLEKIGTNTGKILHKQEKTSCDNSNNSSPLKIKNDCFTKTPSKKTVSTEEVTIISPQMSPKLQELKSENGKSRKKTLDLFKENNVIGSNKGEFEMRIRNCIITNLDKSEVWAEVYITYFWLREIEKAILVRSIVSEALEDEKQEAFLYEIALSNYEPPISKDAQIILEQLEKELASTVLNKMKHLSISRCLKYIEFLLKINMNSQAMVVTKLYYRMLINRNSKNESENFIKKCETLEKEHNIKFKFDRSKHSDLEDQFV